MTRAGACYEVRRVGQRFHIIHLRSGQSVESGIRYRSYAAELCRRYNHCL